MGYNLQDIFNLVLNHIKAEERKESLKAIERYGNKGIGLESWFKLEIVRVLNNASNREIEVKEIHGEGPDLKLNDGRRIELKATTDFNSRYIIEGLAYDNCPCLFLVCISDSNKKMINEEEIKEELRKSCSSGIFLKDDKGKPSKNKINMDVEIIDVKELYAGERWFLGFINRKEVI